MRSTTLLIVLAAMQFSMLAQNTVGLTDYQPTLVDEGYTLIYPHNQPNIYLLDMCGEVVHSWTNADTLRPGNVAYLQENGDIVMTYRPQVFSSDPIWAGGGGATVERRTWDNDVLWSYTLNDSTGRLHHDIEVKPDGNVFAIAWEHFSPEEAIQAGRDSALVPEDGLWSEMVLELSPDGNGGANVVWEWHAWDHLVQNLDPSKDNFGVVSENPNKIDINYGTASAQPSDWLHINAIDYNPYFEHLLLSVPTFDELWIVDYDNFTSGQLLWRWGNPEAYDMGTEEDKQLFYQHDCHWVYDHVTLNNPDFGKIAVFNNRVSSDNGGSHSAVHLLNPSYNDYENNFATDFNTGTFLPADFDWSYVALDSIYTSGLSSFQRLENGNSLICYGQWGDIREVTPSGQIAWRYKTPLSVAGGFASPVTQGTELFLTQNATNRAYRYPSDFGAFSGVELITEGFLELNPVPLNGCYTEGCLDSLACNYNPSAEIQIDDCLYTDAVGECGGNCSSDEDNDSLCDDVDDCIGLFDDCGICNGPGAIYECGCADIPEGYCDCDSNVLDAVDVCGGSCLEDDDDNGVCDDQEVYGCSYPLAENFSPTVTRDDGSCIFPCEGVVNTNVFDWDGDYVVTVTDFLMMLSVYGDTDVDLDGVWDSGDDCVDTNACNYANDPSEPCTYIDVLGVCGGGCEADEDNDSICDDIDTCIGIEDECGVCNGPGPTEVVIEDITILYDSVYAEQIDQWFVFEVGADTTFSITCAPLIEDCGIVSYQGYDYATVLIGEQCWFAENFRATHFRSAGEMPEGSTSIYGSEESCDATYASFDACDPSLSEEVYGRLYSGWIVNDSICPQNWHLPSDLEWSQLTAYLGGKEVAGGLLKSSNGWYEGGNGNDDVGFSGLPSGGIDDGHSYGAGFDSNWWTSTEEGDNRRWRGLNYSGTYIAGGDGSLPRPQDFKYAVRCIRDSE